MTRRLAILLALSATVSAQTNTRPNAALRIALPLAPAYHATTHSTHVTQRRKAKLVSTKPSRRRSRIHHIVWNPLLRGSHESLLKQNQEIDEAGLPRIEDDEQLQDLIDREELVPLTDSRFMVVSPNVKPDRRYARPVVREFLGDLGQAYYEQFHQPIQVTSAVRTAEQQHKLRRHNRNAAPEAGETASSHLSGLTVDLAKRGLTRKQHAWLENYLDGLKMADVSEPAEERRQACFHVMVFERYSQWREGKLAQNTDLQKIDSQKMESSPSSAPQPQTEQE